MNPKNAVVFDLDGTLLDTMQLHNEAWDKTAEHFGLQWDVSRLPDVIGMPSEKVVSILFSIQEDARISALIAWKTAYMHAHLGRIGYLPGVISALQELHKRRILCGVCTGAGDDFIDTVWHLLAPYFKREHTIQKSDYTQGKPAAEPLIVTARRLGVATASITYVGDGLNDYLCAKHAGSQFIHFCSAFDERRIPSSIPRVRDMSEIFHYLK